MRGQSICRVCQAGGDTRRCVSAELNRVSPMVYGTIIGPRRRTVLAHPSARHTLRVCDDGSDGLSQLTFCPGRKRGLNFGQFGVSGRASCFQAAGVLKVGLTEEVEFDLWLRS